jgi:hypothetical protein
LPRVRAVRAIGAISATFVKLWNAMILSPDRGCLVLPYYL